MKKAIILANIFLFPLLILSACAHSSYPVNKTLVHVESDNESPYVSTDVYENAKTIEATKFYKIVYSDHLFYYYIFNEDRDVVKYDGPLNKQPRISIEDDLVKFTLQAGTGLGTQWGFYYDIKSDTFSQIFQCIYDQCAGKVAYGGMNKVIVRDIFDEVQYYREISSFKEPFSPTVEPIASVKFVNEGKSIEVTYLAGDNYKETVEIINLD